MHSSLFLFAFICNAVFLVEASLFVIKPEQGSTCHGGQECTIAWLDDGRSPLLNAIGLCTFGLFTGKQQLVQAISSADVATSRSLTFVPIPGAGPDSDTYYIGIMSTEAKENGTAVSAFSPFFRLDQMSGSFETPLPAATSTVSVPVPTSTSLASLSTITISFQPQITGATTSSGFATSTTSISTTTSTSASSPSPSILISASSSLSPPSSAPSESTVSSSSPIIPSASSTSPPGFITSATLPTTVGITRTSTPASTSAPPSSGALRTLSTASYLMAGVLVSVFFLSL